MKPPIFTIRWINGEPYQEAPVDGPHQRAPYRCAASPIEQARCKTAATVDEIISKALAKQTSLKFERKPP